MDIIHKTPQQRHTSPAQVELEKTMHQVKALPPGFDAEVLANPDTVDTASATTELQSAGVTSTTETADPFVELAAIPGMVQSLKSHRSTFGRINQMPLIVLDTLFDTLPELARSEDAI